MRALPLLQNTHFPELVSGNGSGLLTDHRMVGPCWLVVFVLEINVRAQIRSQSCKEQREDCECIRQPHELHGMSVKFNRQNSLRFNRRDQLMLLVLLMIPNLSTTGQPCEDSGRIGRIRQWIRQAVHLDQNAFNLGCHVKRDNSKQSGNKNILRSNCG